VQHKIQGRRDKLARRKKLLVPHISQWGLSSVLVLEHRRLVQHTKVLKINYEFLELQFNLLIFLTLTTGAAAYLTIGDW
jgi:hypothetical protein